MSNFPIQFTDKVNSPELLAIMQQFGEHTYVDAELINKFRDALNELHARTADTRIVENTGLQIIGTDVVINELWKWFISSVLYTNNSEITLPITLSSTGKQKLCYLCANQENGFEFVYGPESDTNPSAPTIENNLLPVTFFLVTDGTIGTPAEPIVGNIFKKKTEALGYGDPYLSGTNAVIQLRPEGNSSYSFSNPGLISIDGFGTSLISGNPNAEAPYDGKDLFIVNTGANAFTLIHDGTGLANSKFFFIDETNLVIPSGGKVWLKYGPSYCEVLFKSWGGIEFPTSDNKIYGVKNGLAKRIDLLLTDNFISGNAINVSPNFVTIGSGGNGTFIGTKTGNITFFGIIPSLKIVSASSLGAFSNYSQNIVLGFLSTLKSKLKTETFFSIANSVAPTSSRMSVGFIAYANGSMGNINPSGASILAFCNDNGEDYLKLCHRTIAGITQTIDLGTLFPARFANHENVYQMCFYFLGNSLSIATIKNLVTGVYYESPVIEAHWNSGNSMYFNVHMNNNLNAEVVEPAFSGQLTRFMYGV